MAEWGVFSTDQLREVLQQSGVSFNPALYKKKSDLIGLCEVSLTARDHRAAVKQYLSSNAAAATPTPRKSSASSRKSSEVVRTAGRFSLASADGLEHSPLLRTARRAAESIASPARGGDTGALVRTNSSSRRRSSRRRQSPRQSVFESATSAVPPPINNLVESPESVLRRGWRPPSKTRHRRSISNSGRHEAHLYRGGGEEGLTLPVLDPCGNPVRWHIKNPYVIDLVSDDDEGVHGNGSGSLRKTADSPARAGMTPHPYVWGGATPSRKQKRVTIAGSPSLVSRIRWRRVFALLSCALLGVAWMTIGLPRAGVMAVNGVGTLFALTKYTVETIVSTLRPPTLPFCDSGRVVARLADGTLTTDCQSCPDHAFCELGAAVCDGPRYVLVQQFGGARCVIDESAHRMAHRLRGELLKFMRQENGYLACGAFKSTPGQVPLKNVVGFSREAIERKLQEWQQQVPRLFGGETVRSILHEDLWTGEDSSFSMSRPKNGEDLLYVTHVAIPLYCRCRRLAVKFVAPLLAAVVFVQFLRLRWRKRRRHSTLKKAILEVIRTNSCIKPIHSKNDISENPTRGYAVGPRPLDILMMLRGEMTTLASSPSADHSQLSSLRRRSYGLMTKNAPRYTQYKSVVGGLTVTYVDAICNELVKEGYACRSVLAIDKSPFYFDRAMLARNGGTDKEPAE